MRHLAILAASALLAAAPAMAAAEPALSSALVSPALNVADPEREAAFYRDAFALLPPVKRDMGTKREYILRFSADPQEAGLMLLHDSAASTATRPVHGDAFSRLVLRVSDIDALVARLDEMGHPHGPVRNVGGGYRVLELTDPEGFHLEVVQRPTAPESRP